MLKRPPAQPPGVKCAAVAANLDRAMADALSGKGDTPHFPAPVERTRWTNKGWSDYRKALEGYVNIHPLYGAGERLQLAAVRSWQLAPAEVRVSRAAFCLPDQLQRVTGMVYTDDPARIMAGGVQTVQPATHAYLMRDAWLLGGGLYQGRQRFDLLPRAAFSRLRRYFPRVHVETEIEKAAIYSTIEGNTFFGLWLTDDCANYGLAESAGLPVAAVQPRWPHMAQYESMLGMRPYRIDSGYLHEVVIIDDIGQNTHKQHRHRANVQKVLSSVVAKPGPGVFILRRASGVARVMHNELEVAEHLRNKRGFRIVDVTRDSLHDILSNCAGAQVVMGVEGSHLAHGMMTLCDAGTLFTLQPPDRFSGVLKRVIDADGQNYAFVVGRPRSGGFMVDIDEIERTLDLLPN